MEVMQGTIDIGTKCRTFLENKKHAGIVFYKENAFLTGFVTFIISISIFVCLYIGFQYGFKFFLLSSSICLLLLIVYTQIQKRIDEKDGARYFLDEIDEVKILDNQSLSSYSKSQSGSLAGAAIGAVVLGGVGQLAGSVYAALGLGILNKFLEGITGAVLAKIMVLVFIVIFIQKRPQGIFALKSRSAEA